jgi:Na+/glutamate symporter
MVWFFRKRKKLPIAVPVAQPRKAMKKLIVGFIIGGAITSIVGNKLMQRSKNELDENPEDDDRDEKED